MSPGRTATSVSSLRRAKRGGGTNLSPRPLVIDSEQPHVGNEARRVSVSADNRPIPRPGVRDFPLGDNVLLYDSTGETAHALNVPARAVWELCDGTRTISDISHELAELVDVSLETVQPDVMAAVGQFVHLGLIDLS